MQRASRVIRLIALWLGASLALAPAAASRDEGPGRPVRMTVELSWERSGAPEAGNDLPPWGLAILGGGEIADAVAWPPEARGAPPTSASDPPGSWSLGGAGSGRVRFRVKAPLSAVVRVGDGTGELGVRLQELLDGPQERKDASGRIVCARLPWDALEVRREDDGAKGDGVVPPGAVILVAVGLNILTPSSCEVGVRLRAELRPLRGGQATWQQDRRMISPTNADPGEPIRWEIEAPAVPGAYLLECEASWELLEERGATLLGRWFSRRRTFGEANVARRRLVLVVADESGADPGPAPKVAEGEPARVIVDALDLSHPRGRDVAWGNRQPAAGAESDPWPIPDDALTPPHRRRELFRDILARPGGGSPAVLEPAGAGGLAWTSVALHAPRPGRPHRLSVTVTAGNPAALGVGLVAPGDPGKGEPARVVLDAHASGPLVLAGAPATTFSWVVWPDTHSPILLLVNRGLDAGVKIGAVQLAELSHAPPGPIAAGHSRGPRQLVMDLSFPGALDRFGGGTDAGPKDLFGVGENLAAYLAFCGANAVVLDGGHARAHLRSRLDGQLCEDPAAPDRLAILMPALRRQGLSIWLAVPELESADGPNPLQPEALDGWREGLMGALRSRGKARADGVIVRLGAESTLPVGPDAGLDDATYRRFVASAFDAMSAAEIPGLGAGEADPMAARRTFVSGPGRNPWVAWKSREVAAFYRALSEAVEAEAPKARLAVVTPTAHEGGFSRAMRLAERFGKPPEEIWRDAGLDLASWKSERDSGPIVLGGIDLANDPSGLDLAGHLELDAPLAALPRRGIAEIPGAGTLGPSGGLQLSALPLGREAMPLASATDGGVSSPALSHALASLDAGWVLLSGEGASGNEDRIRQFARLYGELPESPPVIAPAPGQAQGYAARLHRRGGSSFLTLVNDTPYPVLLEALLKDAAEVPVDDLKRGFRLAPETLDGRLRLVLEIGPHDLTTLQLGSGGPEVAEVRPHHSEVVKKQMKLQAESLSSWLQQVQVQGEGAPQPAPDEAGIVRAVKLDPADGQTGGWKAAGADGNAVQADRSRDGSGQSLRLDAAVLPVSATSPRIEPPCGRALTIGAWLRSDQGELPVRVWLEGMSDGKPVVRSADVRATARWAPVSIAVTNLPEVGVDHVRIRLEPLAPGRLWADDVTLTSTGMTRPEILTTRRAIFSALQAYRDGRVGDFARLAESRWVRPALEPARTTALPEGRPIR